MSGETYRRCASIAVLRAAGVCSPDGCGNVYQLLLLHKPRKNDAWQLPQGGIEQGETLEQAALRELREEAGIGAHVLGGTKVVYQYDFPKSYRRFRPDNVRGQRVEFVLARAADDAVIVVDDKEIDSYVWVLPDELTRYIKRKEYLEAVRALLKEASNLL